MNKNLFAKKNGTSTPPMLVFCILIIFGIGLDYIMLYYVEGTKVRERTEDAVIVSLQSSCLFDRYKYATSSPTNNSNICFYSGTTLQYAEGDDAHNMEITKAACEYAYGLYQELLLDNVSDKYVVIPDNSTGIKSYIEKFEMVNVYNGTAYTYDIVSQTSSVTTADGIKSTIEVEMNILIDFPYYGEKYVRFIKTGLLDERVQ